MIQRLTLWVSAILVAATVQAAVQPAFMVGILQSDGAIIPFGVFDGQKWVNPWPQAEEQLDSRIIGREDIPAAWWGVLQGEAKGWLLFASDGQSKNLNLLGVDKIPFQCRTIWALLSDGGTGKANPQVSPTEKIGVAVSGGRQVEKISVLKSNSEEFHTMAGLLASEFNRQETEAVQEFITNPENKDVILRDRLNRGQPLDAGQRQQVAMKLTSLYRAPLAGSNAPLYYAEAEKVYVNLAAPECQGYSRLVGWFQLAANGQPHFLKSEMVLDDCDGMQSLTRVPLGLLRINAKTFWLLAEYGYEYETYMVVEIDAGGVASVAETSSGC